LPTGTDGPTSVSQKEKKATTGEGRHPGRELPIAESREKVRTNERRKGQITGNAIAWGEKKTGVVQNRRLKGAIILKKKVVKQGIGAFARGESRGGEKKELMENLRESSWRDFDLAEQNPSKGEQGESVGVSHQEENRDKFVPLQREVAQKKSGPCRRRKGFPARRTRARGESAGQVGRVV